MISIRPIFTDLERVRFRLAKADHVLVALDYDGTVAHIMENADDAALAPEMIAVLAEISASRLYSLAILSGRSLADLRQRIPVEAILAGNHGLEIEGPGMSFQHEGAVLLREAIDHACWDLEGALLSIRGVAVERKQFSATVHYRNVPGDLAGWVETTVRAVVRPHLRHVHVTRARKALEIRPRLHWNKGSAIRAILSALDSAHPGLVSAGDDATDEEMFGVLRWEVSIKVGCSRSARACY
jgi:trehalose 6-phosphate phosphatase